MQLSEKSRQRIAPWAAVAILVVIWEVTVRLLDVPEFIFPGAWATAQALVTYAGPIGMHSWQTFWTTMVGFGIGVAVGLLLGFIIGSSKFLYHACYPLLVGFNAIPKVAFVPILVVWFGIGSVPAILTAFLICFFPIVVNVATGLATLEPEMEDVLRVLGAKRLDVLLKVGMPRSLPYFFASLKVAITLAFVGTVVSETVASNQGIGYLMMSAGSQMRMGLVFAGLIVISAMAMVMYELFAVLEKRMTGWAHRGQR
ncbi:ABC transporter permease [Halomonas chromatireducens]|uniref:Putative aliphatic sulfonates transport permease protein SsuC n=1 Tax=Halomonas chromatireducens TaxID=507626 RepID=A0A120JWI3_9GAMM|nr:ABC transporter permease [Halomonas chromatireducens]AMD01961.1 Putative aliphatic sulfonates transport permease protein SsuC [Halomonas chromatireducens]